MINSAFLQLTFFFGVLCVINRDLLRKELEQKSNSNREKRNYMTDVRVQAATSFPRFRKRELAETYKIWRLGLKKSGRAKRIEGNWGRKKRRTREVLWVSRYLDSASVSAKVMHRRVVWEVETDREKKKRKNIHGKTTYQRLHSETR